MPQSPPYVSIILLNWNSLADTRECLRSLKGVAYANYHVIVVDNGSDNNEGAALKAEFGDFIHLMESETNQGFAAGMNIGIRCALEQETDFVLLLNNDTTVDPAFGTALVEAARSLPDLAAACPKTFFHDRPDIIYSTGGRYSLWTASARQIGRGQQDNGQFERIEVRDYADGVCMLIPREALQRVGLLDEDYFAYWEETDWCARARETGRRCYYVPSANIWHKAERSRSPTNAFHYRYRRNAFLFVRKRGKPYHFATAILMYLFLFGPLYFLRHPTSMTRTASELKALLWHFSNLAHRRSLL